MAQCGLRPRFCGVFVIPALQEPNRKNSQPQSKYRKQTGNREGANLKGNARSQKQPLEALLLLDSSDEGLLLQAGRDEAFLPPIARTLKCEQFTLKDQLLVPVGHSNWLSHNLPPFTTERCI